MYTLSRSYSVKSIKRSQVLNLMKHKNFRWNSRIRYVLIWWSIICRALIVFWQLITLLRFQHKERENVQDIKVHFLNSDRFSCFYRPSRIRPKTELFHTTCSRLNSFSHESVTVARTLILHVLFLEMSFTCTSTQEVTPDKNRQIRTLVKEFSWFIIYMM